MRIIVVGAGLLLVLVVLNPWQGLVGGQDKPPAANDGAGAKNERAVLQQTIGLLAASQVYQAYLNVGFIADGKATGNYAEKDVQQILDSLFKLLSAADKQLEKVSKLDLTKADREGLTEIRRLAGLVRQQGVEMQVFWKTGDKERGERYENLRQESWRGISTLLGLEKVQKSKP